MYTKDNSAVPIKVAIDAKTVTKTGIIKILLLEGGFYNELSHL